MNDRTRRRLEAGQRCKQWIADNAGAIPAGSIFLDKCNQLIAAVDLIENLVGDLMSAVGGGASATDLKGSDREDLSDIMEKVRRAAKAAEPDHPGTQDRYRFRRNMSDEDLLAVARSFATGGIADGGLLKDYGAPDNWVADVTAAANAFEASFGQQASALGSQVATNAQINQKLDQMMQLKRTISLMVPNYCSGDVGAMASWTSAAHVEEALKPKPVTPTP